MHTSVLDHECIMFALFAHKLKCLKSSVSSRPYNPTHWQAVILDEAWAHKVSRTAPKLYATKVRNEMAVSFWSGAVLSSLSGLV